MFGLSRLLPADNWPKVDSMVDFQQLQLSLTAEKGFSDLRQQPSKTGSFFLHPKPPTKPSPYPPILTFYLHPREPLPTRAALISTARNLANVGSCSAETATFKVLEGTVASVTSTERKKERPNCA